MKAEKMVDKKDVKMAALRAERTVATKVVS